MEDVHVIRPKNRSGWDDMLVDKNGVRFVKYSYSGMAYSVRAAATG
jgi:hypothetical protein